MANSARTSLTAVKGSARLKRWTTNIGLLKIMTVIGDVGSAPPFISPREA
jgi:hypothetical protein